MISRLQLKNENIFVELFRGREYFQQSIISHRVKNLSEYIIHGWYARLDFLQSICNFNLQKSSKVLPLVHEIK